jgi:hypothetical protein
VHRDGEIFGPTGAPNSAAFERVQRQRCQGRRNWELAQHITVPKLGGTRKDHPYTCLLAWVGVDGGLLQPPTPTNSEDITAILGDLEPLVARIRADRLESGMSFAASAVVATRPIPTESTV